MSMFDLNIPYRFEIDNFSFGELPRGSLIGLFQDGRHVSPFIEYQLELWFPHLHLVSGNKDYDFIDDVGNKYDAKGFTKNGMKFMPSSMIGSSRTFDYEECRRKIEENNLIIIAHDIIEFPVVDIIFLNGLELLDRYPNACVSPQDRIHLFRSSEKTPTTIHVNLPSGVFSALEFFADANDPRYKQ